MALILDLAAQGVQMFLVLVVAPLILGVTRKVKARLLRGSGRRCCSPTATSGSSCTRRRCWRTTPRGSTASRPT